MSIRGGTDKTMSFNAKDELGDKIDKLTVVMSKLAVKDSHERRPFKPQIYKSRGQNRSYGQGGYQARSNDRNNGYGANNNQDKIIEVIDLEEILEGTTDKIVEKNTEVRGMVTTIEIEIYQGGEPSQEIIGEIEALAMIGLDQGLELVQIGTG